MGLNITYYIRINKKNPAVIRNRMKFKKTGVSDEIKKEAGSDRWIMVIMGFTGVSTWVLPGLNKRFSWSSIPLSVEIVGFILGIIGIIIFLKAQEQNAYASKLLDINKDQKLIDTGLYSHVRHPLYSGAIIWIIGTPIALGMWLDLIPAILFCLTLVLRIKYEEEMLIKGMEGYEDYKTRVKYKLFPKIY
ncbi:MAG: isoprenylcysteine carboxylmethyltransferase family protein [archaeon]|nr:isoprenylcysteine carboxylmethyltransferase family protein [archaeon]